MKPGYGVNKGEVERFELPFGVSGVVIVTFVLRFFGEEGEVGRESVGRRAMTLCPSNVATCKVQKTMRHMHAWLCALTRSGRVCFDGTQYHSPSSLHWPFMLLDFFGILSANKESHETP